MNALYSFPVTKTVTVTKTEQTPEGTLTKNVTEDVAVNVVLKKPSRRENEEAETLYSVELSRCIRAGMLTEPLLVKYYANEGGIFTEEEQKEYSSLLLQFVAKQNEYQRTSLLDPSEEKDVKLKTVTEELIAVQTRLQDFKRAQQSLFNQTAEKKASDKTILWFVTHLTHVAEGESEPKPLFKGASFEERLAELDKAEESGDEFFLRVFQRALLFITFWYMGNAQEQADFKFLEETLAEEEKVETPKTEEKAAE